MTSKRLQFGGRFRHKRDKNGLENTYRSNTSVIVHAIHNIKYIMRQCEGALRRL